jgi:hypothetical protein
VEIDGSMLVVCVVSVHWVGVAHVRFPFVQYFIVSVIIYFRNSRISFREDSQTEHLGDVTQVFVTFAYMMACSWGVLRALIGSTNCYVCGSTLVV